MTLHHRSPWLVAELGEPHAVASWAVVGGGLGTARRVAWLQVQNDDLGLDVDPAALLRARLEEARLDSAVGLLTSTDLTRHVQTLEQAGAVAVAATATVGLSNRVAVGDPWSLQGVGTINLLVVIDRPATSAALLEVLSVAAEARTVAVLRSGLSSTVSLNDATGTGTDCIVVAAPQRPGKPLVYAGKHTPLGCAVGRAVLRVVSRGVQSWLERST